MHAKPLTNTTLHRQSTILLQEAHDLVISKRLQYDHPFLLSSLRSCNQPLAAIQYSQCLNFRTGNVQHCCERGCTSFPIQKVKYQGRTGAYIIGMRATKRTQEYKQVLAGHLHFLLSCSATSGGTCGRCKMPTPVCFSILKDTDSTSKICSQAPHSE